MRRMTRQICLFAILFDLLSYARAVAAEPDFSALLKAQEDRLPNNATYTLKESKAFRLVVQTEQALLSANQNNIEGLALSPQVKARAFDVAVHSIANTRIPPNFLELEKNRQKTLAVAPPLKLSLGPTAADPKAPKFDWRTLAKVTPVRTYLSNTGQDGCGCCWCFAAVSVFEDSHLILFGGKKNDIDASEQQILNCGNTGGCNGDWYMTAWEYMRTNGTAKEQDVPYQAVVQDCKSGVATPYRIDTYGLISEDKHIPTIEDIKSALCKYGPLAVAVEADENFVAYGDGVYKGFVSDGNINPTPSINHAITLIGWDDSSSAWIIKNSWGSDWGSTAGLGSEKGYMLIDYNSNNIGYAAAWAVAAK